MLFTVHRPNGKTATVFRPDKPYPNNPGWKYEQVPSRNGGGNVLDVHPYCRDWLQDPTVPVIFVEGTKKADSLLTAFRGAGERVVVVAIVGVWNWLHDGGKVIPDMYDIPLKGRNVTVMFDSDVMEKWQVQLAAKCLAEHAQDRGARVYMTYLLTGPDGSKVGADDFFAGGGTLPELRLLTRRYDPADFELIRMSRDERLRVAIDDLGKRFWDETWAGMGGHSDRDIYLMLIQAAKQHGKVVADGIRVTKAQGPLALDAKVSTRTLWKALNRLEGRGLIYRDMEGRKPGKSGAFVLRASVRYKGRGDVDGDNETSLSESSYALNLHLRAPRLRWPQPKYTPRRGLVKNTRKVRESPKLEPRSAIKRLGKVRGAVLDALDAAGGTLTLQEIAEILHKKRPRDVRRRMLPMLEDAGIIEVSEDGDTVSLTENWLDALDRQRIVGKEIEAESLARMRYRIRSQAYHRRDEKLVSKPTVAGLAQVRESRAQRRAYLDEQARNPTPQTPSDDELVAVRRDVERLVRHGMKRRFAEEEVFAKYAARKARAAKSAPDPPPRPKQPKLPPKVDGVYVHGGSCECDWCAA
jgi:DNA-binding transcriptional ArsR family regulator